MAPEVIAVKYSSVGKNIRKYRLENNLRQEDLAERTGLSSNYIGMIERNEKIPSLESFIEILNALHVSADMVLHEELEAGYTIKNSLLGEKIAKLPKRERERIYCVVDTMIKFE